MRILRTVVLTLLCVLPAIAAVGEQRIVDVRQGTEMALALSPDGSTLVIDLLGRLWQLPAAGGGAVPLTPENEHARNPRFAPDGRTVVYQRLIGQQWDIWQLDLETGERAALTSDGFTDVEPDYFPDGDSIVFSSDRGGHFSLWAMRLVDHTLTQLTSEDGDASFPTVSATGEIAYVVHKGGDWSLRSLSRANGNQLLYSSSDVLGAPSWRPGAGVVTFNQRRPDERSSLRMLILSDERIVKDLTEGEDVFATRPAWVSPAQYLYAADGQIWRRTIAERRREPVHLFASVGVEDLHASATASLAFDPGAKTARGIAALVTSADGERALFSALGDLWLAGHRRLDRLTDDAFVETNPVFVPGRNAVVFASDRGGGMDLWRLELGDGRLAQLTRGPGKAFRPAVSADGERLAYLATSGLGPWAESELRVLSLDEPGSYVRVRSGLIEAATPVFTPGERGPELSVVAASAEDTRTRKTLSFGPDLEPLDEPVLTARATKPRADSGAWPAPTWEPPAPAERYVIEVGRLFDGIHGQYRRRVDVHIADGRIEAIVGHGLRALPATVIDASDLTMLPGFVDTHAHQSDLAGERLGRAWLASGVTTVREITDERDEAVARAEAWALGRRLGPRLLISPAEAPSESLPEIVTNARILNGPVHAVYGGSEPRRSTEIADSGPAGLVGLLEVEPLPLEFRASPLELQYQDVYGTIIESGRVAVTMLGALHGYRPPSRAAAGGALRHAFETLYTPAERAAWTDAEALEGPLALQRSSITRLIRGGARVAIATDAPAVPYGLGFHLELALLADAGIANDQILRIATAEGALALGADRDIGTLEPGKLADLVLVDGDPLARIGDAANIRAVVLGGRWLDANRLLETGYTGTAPGESSGAADR